MKLFLVLLLSLLLNCSDNNIVDNNNSDGKRREDTQSPVIPENIRQIVESVNLDSIKTTLEVLTGVKPYIIGTDTIEIMSRHSDYKGNDIAADFIEYRLKSFGYNVVNQKFNIKGRNVIAQLDGSERPDEYYIICAHYDSRPASIFSPGADDNGSGTTAVIEAARIFSKLSPKVSIIFALWDEEEQGLIGSKYFANEAKESYMKIKGVFNIDMIGWDSDNDNYMMLGVGNTELDYLPAEKAKEINLGMNLGLNIELVSARTLSSDHLSFLGNGFIVYCFIEDLLDFNNFYHSTNDQMHFINFPYYFNNCKMIIGTLASISF